MHNGVKFINFIELYIGCMLLSFLKRSMCIAKFSNVYVNYELRKDQTGIFQQFFGAYILMDLCFFPIFSSTLGCASYLQLRNIHKTLRYYTFILLLFCKLWNLNVKIRKRFFIARYVYILQEILYVWLNQYFILIPYVKILLFSFFFIYILDHFTFIGSLSCWPWPLTTSQTRTSSTVLPTHTVRSTLLWS